MAAFLRRLAMAAPAAAVQSKFRFPFGTMAAVSAGISYAYYASTSDLVHLAPNNDAEDCQKALKPDRWIGFKLQEITQVSHNTKLFRFSLDPTERLGLDIASCLLTRALIGLNEECKEEYVSRSYTPISDPNAKGFFDLLIKIYPNGKMTQHFAKLNPGDEVEMKGPIQKLKYSPNMKKHIGMKHSSKVEGNRQHAIADDTENYWDIDKRNGQQWSLQLFYIAGGTGITPMLQVIDAIARNADDNTHVSLIFGNVSPADILLKQKLDILACSHPNFKVFYTVSKPSEGWKGGTGHVTKDMIIKGLPSPGNDTLILVCGPPGMMKHICGPKNKDFTQGEVGGLLLELGYTKDMVFKF